MNFKKISIIVISLNTKKEFKKTIESVLNQKYSNFELIVIDGLSIDGTIDYIKQIKKKITKLVIERDSGIYDAMNKGIKLAESDWTIFMNSGDVFNSNFTLNNCCKFFNDSNDVIYGNTKVITKIFNYFVKATKFNKSSNKMSFCHQSSFTKTKVLKSLNFNAQYKLSADFDLFMKLLLKNKKFSKKEITISNIMNEGMSDRNRFSVFLENYKILNNLNVNFFLKFSVVIDILYFFFSSTIKYFLPKKVIIFLLKKKYKIKG